jgi:hypothetical protein
MTKNNSLYLSKATYSSILKKSIINTSCFLFTFNLFLLSEFLTNNCSTFVLPSESGGRSETATGSGSGTSQTTDNNNDSEIKEISKLDYFNGLVEKQGKYIKKYEDYNRRFTITKSPADEEKMNKYGDLLEKLEVEIEKLQSEEGFANPLDFPHSANASDEDQN